ncbi:MAG: GUN4 domain-containing protein [Nostoc sp. SerVER01]|nr:GUN4 domain-containing protein [Nostoc sp. SerVER01]MDZ8083036.1 GUN4 domain-containing protein [Nostoc sp. DcaGUA01]
MAHTHNIFLSHASEDKETFVEELYKRLKDAQYKVWYDKEELGWGDNLTTKITEGLKASQYGIVVISKNYFAEHKEWTDMELKQILASKNILPILHGIDMETIRNSYQKEYEEIKNWVAISSDKGIDYIVQQAKRKIDNLKSEKNIEYVRLRDLLAAKNWEEADKETYLMMIEAVGKKDGDYFEEDELLNFPCTDLRTIDRLWVKYSNGHFGFSVQKEIYLDVGGKADGEYYEEAWKKFCDRVKWKVNSSEIYHIKVTYNFGTSSPRGHIPSPLKGSVGMMKFSKFDVEKISKLIYRLNLGFLSKGSYVDSFLQTGREAPMGEAATDDRNDAEVGAKETAIGPKETAIVVFSRIETCKL